MATETLDLLGLNKNRAKRDLSAGVFTLLVKLPGENTLVDGSHIIGAIEGNVVITRVMLGVGTAFNGTTPELTVTDSGGKTYFTDADIGTKGLTESTLTANSGSAGAEVYEDPIYNSGKTEFTANVTLGGSTDGSLYLLVDYVQLDTVTGKHSK